VTGINHITLATSDLQRSVVFYVDGLGCEPVAHWPLGAYLRAGSLWLALIVDDQRIETPAHYTHIALHVPRCDFDEVSARVLELGARRWKHNRSEGASLYFLDPDGHKLELHTTTLDDRLRAAAEAPWPGLEIL